MRYRRFGKTNLQLSVFSLGTMRGLAEPEQLQGTIKAAVDQGINHLETAQGYGDSELIVGQVLRSLPRDQLVITTKLLPTADASAMAQTLDCSLQRLGLDWIDCVAIHGLNTPEHLEWVTADQGCLAALEKAQQQGKVRHLGFSTHGSLELIQTAIATQRFSFINLHYYYFFQRNAPAIALAHAHDMGIFIISPVDKGGLLYQPSQKLEALCQPFSPLHLTYRFLLSDRRITTLSVGAATPEELTAPLQVAEQDEPLTAAEQAVFKRLDHTQKQALGSDRCSQCYQCLPCPEDIHIPEVLRLRNLAVSYEMTNYGKYRYQMLENAGHWFPGKKANRCTECGDCLPRCPENLNIPALLMDTHKQLKGPKRRRLWEED